MQRFVWDGAKNERLRAERGITFEGILSHIDRGDVLDLLEHPDPSRHPGQRIFVVAVGGYAYRAVRRVGRGDLPEDDHPQP